MQALINDGLVVEHDGIITADEHPGVAYKYRITPKGVEWVESYRAQRRRKVGKAFKRVGEAVAVGLTIAELIRALWP